MSSKARVVTGQVPVTPFAWGDSAPVPARDRSPAGDEPAGSPQKQLQLAALEREAFAKGFEQGERAGAEAAGKRGEAMLRRLAETLDELTTLRATMIRQTEAQIVELALAVARRVLHREVTLDRNLLVAIARVALDRLGESAQVTVRLNPEDYEATRAARIAEGEGSNVSFVADSRVSRGGCRVESELGLIEAGVDAQIHEIARALLGEEAGARVVRDR